MTHVSGLADYFDDKPSSDELPFMRIIEKQPEREFSPEKAIKYY